jgi:hypothetical protein
MTSADSEAGARQLVALVVVVVSGFDAVELAPITHEHAIFDESVEGEVVVDDHVDARLDRHVVVPVEIEYPLAVVLDRAEIRRDAGGQVGAEATQGDDAGLVEALDADVGEPLGAEAAGTVGDVPHAPDTADGEVLRRVVGEVRPIVRHGIVAVGTVVALDADIRAERRGADKVRSVVRESGPCQGGKG